jgi:hypothetical protein
MGPKWHTPYGSMSFHRAQNVSISRVQPPPTFPRNGFARINCIAYVHKYLIQCVMGEGGGVWGHRKEGASNRGSKSCRKVPFQVDFLDDNI